MTQKQNHSSKIQPNQAFLYRNSAKNLIQLNSPKFKFNFKTLVCQIIRPNSGRNFLLNLHFNLQNNLGKLFQIPMIIKCSQGFRTCTFATGTIWLQLSAVGGINFIAKITIAYIKTTLVTTFLFSNMGFIIRVISVTARAYALYITFCKFLSELLFCYLLSWLSPMGSFVNGILCLMCHRVESTMFMCSIRVVLVMFQ